jgi:hypothetical protein
MSVGAGTPVFIRIAPKKRRLRGVVLTEPAGGLVAVKPVGSWPRNVRVEDVEVIRDTNERHLVLTQHRTMRQATNDLGPRRVGRRKQAS